jgi:endoribonuclease LACTB2
MHTTQPSPGAEIVDAVTAAILFEGELLLTRRHPGLPAFPGYHAFPGGKVDAEDEDGPALPASDLPAWTQEPARLLRALARELQEELGMDLPDLVARGAVAALQPLGTALTPPFSARRFNTHFYRIDLRERPERPMGGRLRSRKVALRTTHARHPARAGRAAGLLPRARPEL